MFTEADMTVLFWIGVIRFIELAVFLFVSYFVIKYIWICFLKPINNSHWLKAVNWIKKQFPFK